MSVGLPGYSPGSFSTTSVVLGKFLNLSASQFSCLYNSNNGNHPIYIIDSFQKLNAGYTNIRTYVNTYTYKQMAHNKIYTGSLSF